MLLDGVSKEIVGRRIVQKFPCLTGGAQPHRKVLTGESLDYKILISAFPI